MENKGISHQFSVFLCALCVSVVSSYNKVKLSSSKMKAGFILGFWRHERKQRIIVVNDNIYHQLNKLLKYVSGVEIQKK